MKIMKVLGVVVGIHVFALILIFANPGCSSTTKPSPAPIDTVAKNEPAPSVTATGVSPSVSLSSAPSPMSAAPAFNPDAPALASSFGASNGVRFTPTRPNTSAAATLVAEPVADVIPATTYAVKSGDSLWTIAKKNNLTVADLAAANNLKTTVALHDGQKLIIPAKKAPPLTAAPAAASTATTAAAGAKPADGAAPKGPADSVKHTVKSGESLSMIAKQYGVKQGDIAVANNITDPQKIRAGMQLVIPGWQSTTGKSGSAAKPGTTKSGSAPATGTAKSAVPEIKPLFNAPVISPGGDTRPSSSGDVPVIKVDDSPAAPAPKN